MKTAVSSRTGRRRTPAFTLVELLVVMAIVLILLGMIIPAVGPMIRSSKMNSAAALVVDELNLARQYALSQNREVEIRFYQLGTSGAPNDKKYRAFRTFSSGSGNVMAPLSAIRYLSDPVILSTDPDKSGSTVSTLLDSSKLGAGGTGTETLPGTAGSTAYLCFRFRPTGGTNLDTGTNWYLTLYIANAPKNAATGIPDNYFTAQIDPVTGRVRSYRP